MIISIGGAAGSGKTTVANALAKELGYESFYIGGIRREIAKRRNMTLAEYNTYGETHPETDIEVDQYQRDLGAQHDNFIIQGRTSYHFIPHSIKIYLDVDLDEGAKRIWKDVKINANIRNEGDPETLEELKQSLIERVQSDTARYDKYYHIDVYDPSNFDIVIDTTNITPDEAVTQILNHPLVKGKT